MKFCLLSLTLLHIVYTRHISTSNSALWNLESIAECELSYTALVYNNYGCWCGVGGGHTPMDDIDTCCMHHDNCYDAAKAAGDCSNLPEEYVDGYSWTCTDHVATCKDNQTSCQAAMCECDKLVTECWKRYPKPPKKVKCAHTD